MSKIPGGSKYNQMIFDQKNMWKILIEMSQVIKHLETRLQILEGKANGAVGSS